MLYLTRRIWFCGQGIFSSRFGVVMHFLLWGFRCRGLDRRRVYQRSVGLRGVGVALSINDITAASVWLGSMQSFWFYDRAGSDDATICYLLEDCISVLLYFESHPGSLVLYTLFFWRLNSNRWDCVLYTRCSGEDEMKHLRLSRHFAPNVGAVDERL
jgi:hypothetical protein